MFLQYQELTPTGASHICRYLIYTCQCTGQQLSGQPEHSGGSPENWSVPDCGSWAGAAAQDTAVAGRASVTGLLDCMPFRALHSLAIIQVQVEGPIETIPFLLRLLLV